MNGIVTGIACLDDDFHRLTLIEALWRRLQGPELLPTDLRLPRRQPDVIDVHVRSQTRCADEDPVCA